MVNAAPTAAARRRQGEASCCCSGLRARRAARASSRAASHTMRDQAAPLVTGGTSASALAMPASKQRRRIKLQAS